MNRQRRRMTSLFAALAIVATGVVVTGSVSPTSADGPLGVSVLTSDDHPGMIKVRWTNRPAAVFLGDLIGDVQMLKLQWKADGVAEQEAYLVLYPDSPDAIVIPNLVAGPYDVTVSALVNDAFGFSEGEVSTVPDVGAGPDDPCDDRDGYEGQAHLCASIAVPDGPTPGLIGETFLGNSSRGTNSAIELGSPRTGWLGWDPGETTITSSGLRLAEIVALGLPPQLGDWYRMKIQLTDATGSVPSQWWYANFGSGDTDNGATYQRATEILVPATLDPRAPVQVAFADFEDETTKYEGVFTKNFGLPDIAEEDFAERLCVEFFTTNGNFAQQVCSFVGDGFGLEDKPPAYWSIRLPDQPEGYRVRFVDSVNFDPSFIEDRERDGDLLTYNASFARQWCGLPISDAVQCGSAGSFSTARPVMASDNTVSLSAVLGPAGQLRISLTGVPDGYTELRVNVEDVETGRWFNTYVKDEGAGTWGINAPGLLVGRQYRVSVRAEGDGLTTLEFYLHSNDGVAKRFSARTTAIEIAAPRIETWPEVIVRPYAVRVIKPGGGIYGATPDDDVCIAVVRRSDEAVMVSSCVSENFLVPSVVVLQSFPAGVGDPNATYAAVAWKRDANQQLVGAPYVLQLPNPLTSTQFGGTSYAQGFFDLRALSPGVILPNFPDEPGGALTENLTVVVP